MNVKFSTLARRDLIKIGRIIAEHNPKRALTFVDELEAACLELSGMANAFEVFGRRKGNEVRRRPHGNYLILYRVSPDYVDILRIFHGARDRRKALLSKD